MGRRKATSDEQDHPLKKWLGSRRLPNGFAAKGLDVEPVTVARWFMGAREMRVEKRIAVETMTDGAVTRGAIEDWQAAHLKRLARSKRHPDLSPDEDLGSRWRVVFGPQRGELFLPGLIDGFKLDGR